jgi:uncharacterized protein YqfB (UPF0267 family)
MAGTMRSTTEITFYKRSDNTVVSVSENTTIEATYITKARGRKPQYDLAWYLDALKTHGSIANAAKATQHNKLNFYHHLKPIPLSKRPTLAKRDEFISAYIADKNLSVPQFVNDHGVPLSTLYRWRNLADHGVLKARTRGRKPN